jgi:hypothetical protein
VGWDEFIKAERERLRERRRGKLRRALGVEQLDRVGEKDRLRAEQGLVALKGAGGRISCEHIDRLGPQHREFMLAAERVEVEWLKERVMLLREGGAAPPPIPEHLR